MTTHTAVRERHALTSLATDDARELTPNELETIHGGGKTACSKGEVFLTVKMSEAFVTGITVAS